jgi:hypothetical protein
MIDIDKELYRLEGEFPGSRNAWIRDTPIELDERILSLAHRHSPYLEAQHQLRVEKNKLESNFENQGGLPPEVPPLSDIANIPVQDFRAVEKWSVESESEVVPGSLSASSSETPPPPGAEKVLVMLRKAPQQEWLDTIASIVQLGDIKLALYLLQKYQEEFGD